MTETKKFLGQAIPPMTPAELRQFGLIFAGIISVLFGLILPFLFGFQYPLWPWIVAAVFTTIALIFPKGLNPFYQIWMRFGVIMNIIMTRVILGTVFFLTIVPAGMIFKLRRKDILNRKTDSKLASYRTILESQTNNLKKPY